MDTSVPVWIAIVTNSHILSTRLPPWSDWTVKVTDTKWRNFLLQIPWILFHLIPQCSILTSEMLKKTNFFSYYFPSFFSFFKLPEHKTCFSSLSQHDLKYTRPYLTTIHEHSFFITLPYDLFLSLYFSAAHTPCYFISFCCYVCNTSSLDVSLDSPSS